MANQQSQTERQQQKARQRLTPQQLLLGQVIEKPIDQLRDFIEKKELENPALESKAKDESDEMNDDFRPEASPAEQPDMMQDMGGEEIPVQMPRTSGEMTYGDTVSFYDQLKEQMGEQELDEKQQFIMNYLIGSLDTDGLLRKDLSTINDELAIYHNIDTTDEEIRQVLSVLQQFDPAGVGAQDLQQCLLLQIKRKKSTWSTDIVRQIIENYFDDLLKNHWRKLQALFRLTDEQKETVRNEIRRLNPKPGSSLGEVQGFNIHQITPDFIVKTTFDGQVILSLNKGDLPELVVSEAYTELLNNTSTLSKRDKEALPILKKDIESAKSLIDALHQRQVTLEKIMKAIIRRQYKFFQDGDEADLQPMKLEDIARDTGLDISTVSRVTNEKYAQTRWGILTLRFFFSAKYEKDGEEMATRKIKLALKEIIEHEDKRHPLTDIRLEEEMKKKGFPIARRTIVKYREQMNIPKASLRRV